MDQRAGAGLGGGPETRRRQAILFAAFGQQTTDHESFRRHVAQTPASDLVVVAVLLHGPKRAVDKLSGSFALLR